MAPVALDNVAVIQVAVDVADVVDAVGNDANELNVVAAAVEVHDMLNAVMVAQQTVGRHFDWHQLKLIE